MTKLYVVLTVGCTAGGKGDSGVRVSLRQPAIFRSRGAAEAAAQYDQEHGVVSHVCETVAGILFLEKVPKDTAIRLSRLEDDLVGYMNVTDKTTVAHMVKRIECVHAEIVSILTEEN